MGDKNATYIIERAKRSGAACQACGSTIGKGELRLNCQFWHPGTQSLWNARRHIGCVTGRVALNTLSKHGGVSQLPGFDELTAEEQKEVEELWLSAIRDDATEGLAREKLGRSRKRATGCQKEALDFIQRHHPDIVAALNEDAQLIAAEEQQLEAQADPEKLARTNRKRAKQDAAAATAVGQQQQAGSEARAAAGAGGGGNAFASPAAAAALMTPLQLMPGLLLPSFPPGLLPGLSASATGLPAGTPGTPATPAESLSQMAKLPPAQLLAINAYLSQLLLARKAAAAAAGVDVGGAACGAAGVAAGAAGNPDAAAAAALAGGVITPEPLVAPGEMGMKQELGVKQELLDSFTAAAAAVAPTQPAAAADFSSLLTSPQLLAPGTPTRQLSAMFTTAAAGGYDGSYGSGGLSGGGYGSLSGGDGGGGRDAAKPLRTSTRRRKAPVQDDVFVYGAEAEAELEVEVGADGGGWDGSGAVAVAKARSGRGRGRGRGGRRGRAGAEQDDPDFVA
ncbi:hypothetical protein CHLRE_02g080050v5 [Chlamydomonas reinhardtii]|uniref:PARP-type domain-containing protein n=1 Tax=Chlamydomonas reinhardtii TaxID=3055 RepID=A0A2K3E0H8_CHLRE|nr:uncharacterized protein CHLRE_02g080050v5 [Chlamydomonas reinhardtii]PNW86283.1 hypothetical protein CHLRE_02g080050v5 [Chlamydomonas reinhardtii]